MKYTNILEKLMCVIELVKDNWFDLAFLCFVGVILILFAVKKISLKKCFWIILISYFSLLGYVIFAYHSELGIIVNSLIDNLFTNIYFPSAYVYLFILIVIDLVFIDSFVHFKGSKVYKWIHGIYFFVIQFIFTLILELLSKNKIDIFSKTSLFSNKDLVMLLEFSINIFIMWLVSVLFVYVTNVIVEKITLASVKRKDMKMNENESVDMNTLATDVSLATDVAVTVAPKLDYVEATDVSLNNVNTLATESTISIPPVVPVMETSSVEANIVNTTPIVESSSVEVQPYMNVMPIVESNVVQSEVPPYMNIVPVIESSTVQTEVPSYVNVAPVVESSFASNESVFNQFDLSDLIPKKQEAILPNVVSSQPTLVQEEVPVTETNHYTLNDYRLFNQILKEIKEHNHNNTVTIDKDLEYRLITKYSTETYKMFRTMLKIYSN